MCNNFIYQTIVLCFFRRHEIISVRILLYGINVFCLVLIHVTGLGPLALGRFIMGVAAGLASSSLTTYIVDAAPPRPSWLASVASSQSSQVGLTLGSLVSGAIVQTVAGARTVSYVVMIALWRRS